MADNIDTNQDATALAAAVREGQTSPEELVAGAIQRIEEVNSALNAVTIPLYEKARREAADLDGKGPFGGVPYLLKDLAVTSAGDPSTHGVLALKTADYRPAHDSHLVAAMRDAGFLLLGKTNVPDLGMSATTESTAWGVARNPWDTSRSPGGSSGGSAAAVAAGIVPLAHANDAGGSTRIPASHNGVLGIKTSRGRISAGPEVHSIDGAGGMAAEGAVALSIRDIAGFLDVTAGRGAGDLYSAPTIDSFSSAWSKDPGTLRIGVLDHDPMGEIEIDQDCGEAPRIAAAVLADLGHHVEEAFPPAMTETRWPEAHQLTTQVLLLRELERLGRGIGRPLTADDVQATTWAATQAGEHVTGRQYADGLESLRRWGRDLESWWDQWDLLLSPTTPLPAPVLGDALDFAGVTYWTMFTVAFNASGQPALSVPIHRNAEGLPIGVQVVGAFGREDLLLQVANQLEAALPWRHLHPPCWAGE